MIVAMNEKVPREDALKHTTVGAYVSLPANEFERISAIFREHSHDLGNHHLKMWLSIEAEISRIGSPLKAFYLNKERQEWFDELEKEYQRLKKELEKRE
jgi:hypothetical protein